ncbi:isochorismatase [Planotetraspora thailandica]|uniref:Isochorismatase n=1 Tax=Planotetraspora thailandica TaxID=487172 RepID=A0A8J4DD32_9ACTN|nr:cysteine hydrolase [Planotetraspora thailandica]GII58349.1 isochorismatase [Planotetraspora thailandica]
MTASPAWLTVVDMQRVFAEPSSGWFTPRFAETVGPIKALTKAFGSRVTFTRFIAPDVPEGSWREYYRLWPFALQTPDSRIYELVDDFAEAPGRRLAATTFGKWTPELAADVGPGGRMVVAGVSTDCCVLSTVVAAADAGVEVLVVSDACAGMTDESHRQALDILALYGPLVRVVTTAEVLRDLEEAGGADS